MHRGHSALTLLLAVVFLTLAAAGPVTAQSLEPMFQGPFTPNSVMLPFCTQQDKDAALAAYDAEIQGWNSHIDRLNEFIKTASGAAARSATASLEVAQHGLARAKDRRERAKTRPVVDCTTLKGVLPRLPKMLAIPWTPQKGFCDPKAAAAYIASLRVTLAAAERNREDAYLYRYALNTLLEDIKTDPKSKYAAFRSEIAKAQRESEPIVQQAETAVNELEAEIRRALKEEPIKCPTATTGTPTGAPTTDGPKTTDPPKPATDGPKPPDAPPAWKPHRPTFSPISAPVVPAFCDEFARNAFLKTLNDVVLAAGGNVDRANAYLGDLNAEFAKANADKAPTAVVIAIKQEIDAYAAVGKAQREVYDRLEAVYRDARVKPLDKNCPKAADGSGGGAPAINDGPKSVNQPKAPTDGPTVGCACEDRRPIEVGPNSRVGSGARTREKAVSTAMGLVGGLLGGGGGGGSSGPRTVVCRINEKEMTVFDDPETGVSLKVGAKQAGERVTVFAEIAKSPDSGTFQTAYLQDSQGAKQAPRDVGICGLWGEWQLTVSWTKTTYVNDQVVSREEGGWSKSGAFHIPGTVSSAAAPDGLWKRLGFSNASHGAREVALQYDVPVAKLADGVAVLIHVTRPGQNPVTTAPFALTMRQGPHGILFERAPDCPCRDAVARR